MVSRNAFEPAVRHYRVKRGLDQIKRYSSRRLGALRTGRYVRSPGPFEHDRKPRVIGGLECVSGGRHRRGSGWAVRRRDRQWRVTFGFPLNRWGPEPIQPPGFQPAREVLDHHCFPSTALATIQPAFTDAGRLALAGFLAGCRGLAREAYALDPRQFTTWCRTRSLALFSVRRADIESFARDLEARGRARATVTGRLCTIAGFYRYAVEEEPLEHSPAAHVQRPRVDYESHAVALERNELGALPVAAGLGPPPEHALISPFALNRLQVSEATGADNEHMGLERGYRTVTITRKGGKVVTIPLAPRTARAIDLAIVERTDGPVFLATDGRRLDRHGAGRIVRKVSRHAGIAKTVTSHTLRHAFMTAALDAGVPLRDVQEAAWHADPRTTMRYDRARGSLDRHATRCSVVPGAVHGQPEVLLSGQRYGHCAPMIGCLRTGGGRSHG
jgi:integrase/recombinase XerD